MLKRDSSEKHNRITFKKSLILLVVAVTGFTMARVGVSNVLAVSGQRLAAANQKIKLLQEENQLIENEISKLNSLARVESLAKEKGFVVAKNVEILSPSVPIANR